MVLVQIILKQKIDISLCMHCQNFNHLVNIKPFLTLKLQKKCLFQPKSIYIFLISQSKNMMWVLIRNVGEMPLMSTHIICFPGEIKKKIIWISLLSEAMNVHLLGILYFWTFIAEHSELAVFL